MFGSQQAQSGSNSKAISLKKTASSFPRAPGIMEKVLEIPSCASLNGSLETEFKDATAPWLSLWCIGLAPGANACPAFLPSGVEPVAFPYTTLEVMVRIEVVGIPPR